MIHTTASTNASIGMLALLMLASLSEAMQLEGVIDLTQANVTFTGYGRDSHAGQSVAPIGDFNGDGYDDVLVGSPGMDLGGERNAGSAFLLYGGAQGVDEQKTVETASAGVRFHGNAERKSIGYTVSGAGDLNGDGLDDILIGKWPIEGVPHEVYLIYGRSGPDSLSGAYDIDSADAIFEFNEVDLRGAVDPFDYTGFGLNRVGDLDGDGSDDLLIGANWARQGFDREVGSTFLFYGNPDKPFSGVIRSNMADAVIEGEGPGDKSGWAIAPEFDFDGDGRNDLLVTAPYDGRSPNQRSGTSYLFYGAEERLEGRISLTEADLRIEGKSEDDRSGRWVGTGDFNGDGIDDLVVGARAADVEGNEDAGEAYVILGSSGDDRTVGVHNLAESDLVIVGDQASMRMGRSVASAGDVNQDGIDDLLIGATGADPPELDFPKGAVFLVYGRKDSSFFEGVLTPADADAVFWGDWGSLTGYDVSSAGDFNGDGTDDFVIGAPYTGLDSAGAAYIVFGRPIPEPRCLVLGLVGALIIPRCR